MTKLYELGDAYATVRELLDDDAEWQGALDAIQEEASAKALAIGVLLREQRAERDVIRAEIARLTDRAATLEKRTAGLEAYLLAGMQATGLAKAKDHRVSVWIIHPQHVEIPNTANIPDVWCTGTLKMSWADFPDLLRAKAVRTVDVRGVHRALSDGQQVAGARLETTDSLVVR